MEDIMWWRWYFLGTGIMGLITIIFKLNRKFRFGDTAIFIYTWPLLILVWIFQAYNQAVLRLRFKLAHKMVEQHFSATVTEDDENYEAVAEKCRVHFRKWINLLNLNAWSFSVNFYSDMYAVQKRFGDQTANKVIGAGTYADWKYLDARIDMNLRAISNLEDNEIEKLVIHELCHMVVNEMREKSEDHEERVVSHLTAAFYKTGIFNSPNERYI